MAVSLPREAQLKEEKRSPRKRN